MNSYRADHTPVPSSSGAIVAQQNRLPPLMPIVQEGGGGINIDYASIIGVLVKWRLMILGILLAAIIGAIIFTLVSTPMYRGSSTIEIAEAPVQVVEVGKVDDGESNSSQFFVTQLGLLRSATLAERTARQVNRGNGRQGGIELTAGALGANLTITPQVNSRLVDVSFVSADPNEAAKVPNALTENFIASNMERRFATTAFARKFLEGRIATVKARLEASEKQLVAYAQKEGIVNLSGTDGAGTSLTSASLGLLNGSLAAAKSERIAAEQEFRQESLRAGQKVISDPTVQGLRSQRVQLEADYQDKLGIYKPDYPVLVRLRERINGLDKTIASATAAVTSASATDFRANYIAARGRENALQAQVDQLKSAALNLRGRSIDYNILQRDLDTNRVLYDGLLQRYKEVGVAGGVGDNLISIVDAAKVPSRPFKPNLILNLLLAVAGGLLVGIAAAFAIELTSDKVATPEDVEKRLELPLLGVVPEVKRPQSFIESLNDVRSDVSESYISLRTALQYASATGLPHSLLLTSTQPAEGKSSSSFALSSGLAKLGMRTLLIDADMRNPSLGVGGRDRVGFSDMLTGNNDFASALQELDIPNLWLVSSGPLPPAPAELLGSPRLKDVLDRLTGMFDIVVVDAPPVLGLADAPLLAAHCDATILVCRANGARRPTILSAIRRLRATGGNVLGVLLTRYKPTYAGYGDQYGYGYSYGHSDEQDERTLVIGGPAT